MKIGQTRFGPYTWIQSGEDRVLSEVCRDLLKKGSVVSFDLETTGLSHFIDDIVLVAFTQDGINSYVFDPREVSPDPFINLISLIPTSNHNLRGFDAKFVREKWGVRLRFYWDTMVGYQLATPGIGADLGGSGLEELADRFLNEKLDKDVREKFIRNKDKTVDEELVMYAAEDCQAAHRLIPITRELVEVAGHTWHMEKVELPFMPVLDQVEHDGAPFDYEAAVILREEIREKTEELGGVISEALSYRDKVVRKCTKCRKGQKYKKDGGGICEVCKGVGTLTTTETICPSPTSGPQLIKAFVHHKVKVPTIRRSTGLETDSIAKEALKLIDHPAAKLLLELSEMRKQLTGFLIPWTTPLEEGGVYNTKTGCIHTTYTQTFTETARLCVAKDTPLETTIGTFNISDLKDQNISNAGITTHEGRIRPIKQVIFKGYDKLYKVTTEDGRTITCTKGHRFLTPNGWKKLEDLKAGSSLSVFS